MKKFLDLRPTEEETCNSKVVRFYNEAVHSNGGKIWITLVLKSMALYAGIASYHMEYFQRITMIIDEYIESGIHSTLVNIIE